MKGIIRVLFLLLAIALFAAACFSPLSGNGNMANLTINLAGNQGARGWGSQIDPNIIANLSYKITLKRNSHILDIITISNVRSQINIQVPPGYLDVIVEAYYHGWDFAKGSTPHTVNVRAGSNNPPITISMNRIASGIVMDIPNGDLLDFGGVFTGETKNKSITIWNFSENDLYNLTVSVSTGNFRALSSLSIPQNGSEVLNVENFPTLNSSGDSTEFSSTITISDNTGTLAEFTAKITVCALTSGGIQKMIDLAANESTITIPNGDISMDKTIKIEEKNVTLTWDLSDYNSCNVMRAPMFEESFFKIMAGGILNLDAIYDPSGTPPSLNFNGYFSSQTTDSLVHVTDGGTFKILSYVIQVCNNTSENGGAIYIDGGTFIMHDGSVSGTANNNGGGVYINGGTFIMDAGSVYGTAANNGGGVYIANGSFIMHNGSFNVSATKNGGGVYIANGSFIMNDGRFYGSANNNGGGVYIADGSFSMRGGTIYVYGREVFGGGVYISANGSFTKPGSSSGGVIDTLNSSTPTYQGKAVYWARTGGALYRDNTLSATDSLSTSDMNTNWTAVP